MSSSSREPGSAAALAPDLLPRLLGLGALASLVAAALLGPLEAVPSTSLRLTGDVMWVKVLGLVCAGVFMGAAIFEAAQVGRRGKHKSEDESAGESKSPDAAEPQGGPTAAR